MGTCTQQGGGGGGGGRRIKQTKTTRTNNNKKTSPSPSPRTALGTVATRTRHQQKKQMLPHGIHRYRFDSYHYIRVVPLLEIRVPSEDTGDNEMKEELVQCGYQLTPSPLGSVAALCYYTQNEQYE